MTEAFNLRIRSPIEAAVMAELEGRRGASQFPNGCNVTEAVQSFKKGLD